MNDIIKKWRFYRHILHLPFWVCVKATFSGRVYSVFKKERENENRTYS